MPAYDFRERFAPLIVSGMKEHTIRRRRKRPTRVGDRLMLYTGMRTKGCRLIATTTCTAVRPVELWPWRMQVMLDGRMLSINETAQLAQADGFDDITSFFRFFRRYKAEHLDDFVLIRWEPWRIETGEPRRARREG